jgi:GAF domain-containing protein
MSRSRRTAVAKTAVPPPPPSYAELEAQIAVLTAERDEALQRETATAEILQVINSSPGDRTPVFEAILEKARVLCGAVHGSLSLYDGERFRAVAINTRSQELAERMRQGFLPSDFPNLMPLLDGARLVHVPDLAEIGNPYGARTGLFVPLRKDDTLLGLISTVRLEIRPFSGKEIALVENFAAQAVIAMENARLLGELQARTRDLQESLEYQTATSDVLNVISRSTFDLQPILDTLVETGQRLCGSDQAALSIREGDVFRCRATRSRDPALDAFLRGRTFAPGSETVGARVALAGEVVHIPDITTDPDYRLPETATLGKLRTVLGVPLLRDGSVVGTLTLARSRVEPFTVRQIELVRTFADQAVIAIENARLLGELQARTRDLEESLEYQTATSEVLNVISRSTSDVQPVLDTVVETAARLCGAESAGIYIREGEVYRPARVSSVHRSPSFGRALASEPLSPVAAASPGGWRSKAGSCISRTSALTRTSRCPKLWSPGDARCLGCRSCATASRSALSGFPGSGSSRSPSGRSNWYAPLPTRRSSRSRTRGSSPSCRPGRTTSKNRSSTRPRPATY